MTSYLRDHPGGPEVLEALAGQDALKAFQEVGHSANARRRLNAFLKDDTISATVSPTSVRQKLFTAEEPYNLHKTLGALVAFHFLVLRLYGHFVTPLPFVAAPLAAVGCGVLGHWGHQASRVEKDAGILQNGLLGRLFRVASDDDADCGEVVRLGGDRRHHCDEKVGSGNRARRHEFCSGLGLHSGIDTVEDIEDPRRTPF